MDIAPVDRSIAQEPARRGVFHRVGGVVRLVEEQLLGRGNPGCHRGRVYAVGRAEWDPQQVAGALGQVGMHPSAEALTSSGWL